jgi:hypothetical protein
VDAEVKLEIFLVRQDEVALDGKVLGIVGVDNRKLAPAED